MSYPVGRSFRLPRQAWPNSQKYSKLSPGPAKHEPNRRFRIMFKVEKVIDARGQTLIQDPPIARFFFQSTITSVLWLAVRLYVGYDFVVAGWHKFTTPAWLDGSGAGILGYWKGALG